MFHGSGCYWWSERWQTAKWLLEEEEAVYAAEIGRSFLARSHRDELSRAISWCRLLSNRAGSQTFLCVQLINAVLMSTQQADCSIVPGFLCFSLNKSLLGIFFFIIPFLFQCQSRWPESGVVVFTMWGGGLHLLLSQNDSSREAGWMRSTTDEPEAPLSHSSCIWSINKTVCYNRRCVLLEDVQFHTLHLLSYLRPANETCVYSDSVVCVKIYKRIWFKLRHCCSFHHQNEGVGCCWWPLKSVFIFQWYIYVYICIYTHKRTHAHIYI